MDNFNFLLQLSGDQIFQKASEQTTKELNEEFLRRLKMEIFKSPEANEIWNNTLEKLIQERSETIEK